MDAGVVDDLEGVDVAGLDAEGASVLALTAGAGADAFLLPPAGAWRTFRPLELLPPPPV